MTNLPESRLAASFWIALAIALVSYHLALVFSGLVPNLISRPLHMAFILPFALVFDAQTPLRRITGCILAALGIAAALWVAINSDALGDQYGFIESNFQLAVAVTLLLVVLETARRGVGWPLPLVAGLALLYGLFGQYIPGEFGHSGTPVESFFGTLTIAEGGIWGTLTGVWCRSWRSL